MHGQADARISIDINTDRFLAEMGKYLALTTLPECLLQALVTKIDWESLGGSASGPGGSHNASLR